MIRLFVPIRAGSTPGKPASPSMSNIRLICKTSIAAYLALAAAAQSETYVWDPAVDGGATAAGGVWDLTTPNWSGAPSRLWPNESGIDADFAVFEGVGVGPFTVNLGAAVVANGLVFNTNGYTISDGGIPANTLTLSGSAPLVSVTTAGDVAGITARWREIRWRSPIVPRCVSRARRIRASGPHVRCRSVTAARRSSKPAPDYSRFRAQLPPWRAIP
jgi:hypothetical protein